MSRQRRRFGNVKKHRMPSGEWRYYARYKGPDGRERRGPHAFVSEREAERFLSFIELQINRGEWTDPKLPTLTLEQYATDWLEHRPLAVRTRELYDDLLRLHVNPQLGRMPINKVTAADVRRWHSDRLKATGPTRARQAYGLLRTILKTAVSDGLLSTQPCQIKGAGQSKSPERPYLSRDQAEAMASAMPSSELRAVIIVTLWAHLRLGELLALRRGDVDLDAGTVRIHRAIARTKAGPVEGMTKTKQARTVHLPRQAVDELRRHLDATGPALPSAHLFRHNAGGPLREHHVRHAWGKARGALGLEAYHFHDLRHAGLTYATQQGASLREVMARAGHATQHAAMIYQHAAQSRDVELAARLSDPMPTADDQASDAG